MIINAPKALHNIGNKIYWPFFILQNNKQIKIEDNIAATLNFIIKQAENDIPNVRKKMLR